MKRFKQAEALTNALSARVTCMSDNYNVIRVLLDKLNSGTSGGLAEIRHKLSGMVADKQQGAVAVSVP